jgi:alpha-D-ribose 1-methylphosphonate 5-triphosphate synthase subunit PhnI
MGNGQKMIKFVLGYGICYGQNETKAIAMSILDRCLEIGKCSKTQADNNGRIGFSWLLRGEVG